MRQIPLLRDNIVVNVILIDDDTMIMTKAEHKELMAKEDAEYKEKAEEWRSSAKVMQDNLEAENNKLVMARATLGVLKEQAETEQSPTKAQAALRRILATEKEITAQEASVAEMRKQKLPDRPRLIRAKRWFAPDDVNVGPEGGNIGDVWDGKQYVRPEKKAS